MTKEAFPKIGMKAWAQLRARAAGAPSTRFTPQSVAALLDLGSPDSARTNIIRPMKAVGLIDDEGALTTLGNKWRNDATYGAACDEILEKIYPDDLRSLVDSDGKSDPKQVRSWFEHHGFGSSNAGQMATTFSLISGKTPPDPGKSEPSEKRRSPQKPKTAAKTPPPKPPEEDSPSDSGSNANRSQNDSSRLNLHMDIQIHIPSDASPDQIDQIFASMARHLYK